MNTSLTPWNYISTDMSLCPDTSSLHSFASVPKIFVAKSLNSLRSRSRRSGQICAELALAALLTVALSTFISSLIMVELAIALNDEACRDAARAAAQASNATSALQVAQAAMVSHQCSGVFYGPARIVTSSFVYQDFAGNAPANVSPYVQITTAMPCAIPIPIPLISGPLGVPTRTTFYRTYRFPIVKLTLYLPS